MGGLVWILSRTISQEPARQPARETARNAGGAGGGNRESICRARRCFFAECGIVAGLWFDNGSRCGRGYRLVAILRQRFAGQKNFFGAIGRRGTRGARTFLTTVVIASLLATIAIVVVTKFTALRRSILGWRKVPPAGTALWTATAITPATTAPTSAPTAITSASVMLLALAVIATVISEIMAGTPGVILSWVEVWREVLRRRSIGFRLALFS